MICRYCGRDCKTALGLKKHEAACDQKLEFYHRHEKLSEKCPICNEIWADFWKKEPDLWVCLKCGCTFVPRSRFEEVERRRQESVRG